MQITKTQYAKISFLFPVQRGNVVYSNIKVLRAMVFVIESHGNWRKIPPQYGKWNSIYKRVHRWHRQGVLYKILEFLYSEHIVNPPVDVLLSDILGFDGNLPS
ncbi:MAG: transposase [Oscillospiraceae bacterium]